MPFAFARLLVLLAAVYLALGALFAALFAARWAGRADPVAASGTPGFRVLIVPGSALLWPLLLARLLTRSGPPAEVNAHRLAAFAGPGPERGPRA